MASKTIPGTASGKTNMGLFIACLVVIVLRACSSENPHILLSGFKGGFFDSIYSLCFSGSLLIIFAIWIISRFSLSASTYRPSRLEAGTLLFIVAAFISTFFASNKRSAITDSITMIAPMLMAIVLADILDSSAKKKILLTAIVAIAAAGTYQCSEQFFSGNKIMLEEYNKAPAVQLEQLGIVPGSFQQMLYEHRLESKDVRGFFTTSNSSGSFAVFSTFLAIALFAGWFRNLRKTKKFKQAAIAAAIVLIIFSGFLLSASKGAAVSLAVAGSGLLAWLIAGETIKKYRLPLLAIILVFSTAITVLAISYGRKHGSLPGGNSILVRWQYWVSATEMVKDNWLTGIGGANFNEHYPRYKTPSALETVRDPHCFPLSLLSQYGIIGLTGFLAAVLLPLSAIMFGKKERPANTPRFCQGNLSTTTKLCGISAVLAMLLIRPILLKVNANGPIDVMFYVFGVMYLAPAFIFGLVLWLYSRGESKFDTNIEIEQAAVLLGIFAMLLHNLIDFAIFEPGILTAFWAAVAFLASGKRARPVSLRLSKSVRAVIFIAVIAGLFVFARYSLFAPAIVASNMERAKILMLTGRASSALEAMNKAIDADELSPQAALFKTDLCLNIFRRNPNQKRKQLLLEAEKAVITAIERNDAGFKSYQKLSQIYDILADLQAPGKPARYETALKAISNAIDRYPGSSELRIKAGKIAEKAGETAQAIAHYKKCVEIEDSYTLQFKKMYPGKPVFSRIGKIKYKFATGRIEELGGQ